MQTLRGRFLSVIFLGVALPIAAVGAWLARDTRNAGEELLRERLRGSLAAMARAIGERWVDERSRLLQVAETDETRRALESIEDPSIARPSWTVPPTDLRLLETVVGPVELHDASGAIRGAFTPAAMSTAGARVPVSMAVSVTVFEPGTGRRTGSLHARIAVSSLIPDQAWSSGVAGTIVALFDSTGRQPLSPIPMPAALLEGRRFAWNGDDWLVERHQLVEPRIELAMTAPLGAFTEPFARAARRGTLAIAAVLALALLAAALTTHRIVDPLRRVALASDAVARGQLDQSVPEQGPDEIRMLGRSFNAMTNSLRAMLRQLAQRESVAAVGEFASSLAHEVRNPLTSLRFDLEHAREHLQEPARADDLIGRAVLEVERLDRVVSGSLSIARSGTLSLSPVDVRVALRGAAHAAEPTFLGGHGHVELRLPDAPVIVQGNEVALQQLFLNLMLNAAEASGTGDVTSVDVKVAEASVRVMVRDTGRGIDTVVLERVVEPFFTTKPSGTGLGLAVARRIAVAHGGVLEIESAPGVGTTVTVTLRRSA